MSSNLVVHDRIGIHGQKVLIDDSSCKDIPEDLVEDLNRAKEYSEELNNARYELGRLMQVVNNLTLICNRAEKNLADTRNKISKALDLGEGNWAIDFENKKVGRVINDERKPHTVV